MAVFDALTPAERARQLANPDGEVGLAVAEWLDENNRQANAGIVALLAVGAGHHVLEIGFGSGRTAPLVSTQAPDVRYAGIDISPTMVAEASSFNAALVEAGTASFHLASAHEMPFDDDCFDRVFSTGVVHFWAEPLAALVEVRRVLRPAGKMLMACLSPQGAPGFAQAEYGFHLREAPEWDALCREAGFADIKSETVESQQISPDGLPTKRLSIRIGARA
jgi:ubiquinone/menaquinone biosynthesis C-methylase UbiE